MQKAAMMMTIRALWDNKELPGLTKVGEFKLEYKTGTVSKQKTEFDLNSIPVRITPLDFEYLAERNTETDKFFKDFFELKQTKDCIIIYGDGHGYEYDRTLLVDCECGSYTRAEVTTESPPVFKITINIKPKDYKFLS